MHMQCRPPSVTERSVDGAASRTMRQPSLQSAPSNYVDGSSAGVRHNREYQPRWEIFIYTAPSSAAYTAFEHVAYFPSLRIYLLLWRTPSIRGIVIPWSQYLFNDTLLCTGRHLLQVVSVIRWLHMLSRRTL